MSRPVYQSLNHRSKKNAIGGRILHLIFAQRNISHVSGELHSSVLKALEILMHWSTTTSFVTLTNDPVVMEILGRCRSKTINVINYYQLTKFGFDLQRSVRPHGDRLFHEPGLTLEFHDSCFPLTIVNLR
jgi:hypothetical protein